VEQYLKANLLWRENEDKIRFTEVLELDLDTIEPSVAGPKRPQDKITLSKVKDKFIEILKSNYERGYINVDYRQQGRWLNEGGRIDEFVPEKDTSSIEAPVALDVEVETLRVRENGLKSVNIRVGQSEYLLSDGSVVIAAITSCTNTSNPSVMLGAGLVAKKAVERGSGENRFILAAENARHFRRQPSKNLPVRVNKMPCPFYLFFFRQVGLRVHQYTSD
jgi:aconitate hydratase